MRRGGLALFLVLTACAQSSTFAFHDTSVTLPPDPMSLPEGRGMDAVMTNCLACHSSAMMLTQPRLTRKEWESEVSKMVRVYKAPVDASAIPQIVDYLVATNERLTPRTKIAP